MSHLTPTSQNASSSPNPWATKLHNSQKLEDFINIFPRPIGIALEGVATVALIGLASLERMARAINR